MWKLEKVRTLNKTTMLIAHTAGQGYNIGKVVYLFGYTKMYLLNITNS